MEPVNSIDKLQQETLDKCQEYYDEVDRWIPGLEGYVWLKNDETGQLMVYTRGKYTDQIMDFIKTLN